MCVNRCLAVSGAFMQVGVGGRATVLCTCEEHIHNWRARYPSVILASLGRFALHRDDRKFRGSVAVANGVRSALVQQQGGRRFMLEGVSVDPGRTMLPVSPQISLRVESPLSTGTVECCRRARVSEFCFTPLSPEHALLSILLKGGGFGWMSCTRGARVSTARRRTRRSVCGFRAKAVNGRRRR